MPLTKAPIPIMAFEDQRMNYAALRVLGILCSYADKDGYCYPSQATIAKRLNVSRPAVNRQIQVLEKLGYVEVERRSGKSGGETSCLYRIITPNTELEYCTEDAESQWLPETDRLDVTPPVTSDVTPPVTSDVTPPVTSDVTPPVTSDVTPPVTPDVTQRVNLTYQFNSEREEEEREEVNLPRAREELAAADFSDDLPDDPFGDSLWATPPEAPETPEEVNCQAILPGNKPDQAQYPETLAEARNHPDIQIYRRVTGVLPLPGDYKAVVDAVQFLRESCPTDDLLVEYLTPHWQKWKSSKRKDGKPYNPNKPAWLTDWAVVGANPNLISQESVEDGRYYSYTVTNNPTPAQRAQADYLVY
ncbi:MAG: helix-turn-helix domain-containing protein [Anaerolineae bacterium]|nr:helix-turn-helix domain-containing protein [Anaerolineae bacterium]